MKVINCRSIGVDCDFEARGNTVEEVLQSCSEHARKEHGMTELAPDLESKVRAAIRDEPARTSGGGA